MIWRFILTLACAISANFLLLGMEIEGNKELRLHFKYKVNPSIQLMANYLVVKKRTLRNKSKRLNTKDKIVYTDERVEIFKNIAKYAVITFDGMNQIASLSNKSLRVYFHIMKNLEHNKHKIVISPKIISEELNMSLSSVSRVIKELLHNCFIFRTESRFEYFINVSICYRGRLSTIYEEYYNTTLKP